MKFSVIGNLQETAALLSAVHASQEHALAAGFVSGELKDRIAQAGLPMRLTGSAEDILVDQATDVVVIAVSTSEEAVYLARQASQADCHVVVVVPEDVSVACSYEMNLLLDESRRGIVVLSGRCYVDLHELPTDANARVRQLALSLPIAPPADVSLERVQLYAVDAMCGCGLAYSRVTAIDVRAADDTLLSRTITLGASDVAEAKLPPATLSYSAAAGVQDSSCRLMVTLHDGRQLALPFVAPWQLSGGVADSSGLRQLPTRLAATLISKDACQRQMQQFSNSLELLAGIEKSLRRRRTVDVYFEGASERGMFKSQMTALGCGVLTYVSLGMIVYLMIAQIANLPSWALQTARVIWIAPVIIFLGLQLLLPLTRSRDQGREDSDREAGHTQQPSS